MAPPVHPLKSPTIRGGSVALPDAENVATLSVRTGIGAFAPAIWNNRITAAQNCATCNAAADVADNVSMQTIANLNDAYLLAAGAFFLTLILYIMRRRVRLGKKKGTF